MAKLPDRDDDDWPCPQVSSHPSRRVVAPSVLIPWAPAERLKNQPGRQRVLGHTCSCCVVVYELISGGGAYMVRRTHQTTPCRVVYAGPWTRGKAERLWQMLLTGEAR